MGWAWRRPSWLCFRLRPAPSAGSSGAGSPGASLPWWLLSAGVSAGVGGSPPLHCLAASGSRPHSREERETLCPEQGSLWAFTNVHRPGTTKGRECEKGENTLLQYEADSTVGLPWWLRGKESLCQCRRHRFPRFNPWVGKIPLEEEMATHSRFLPGKSMVRRAWRATVHGVTRVGHDLATQLPPPNSMVKRLRTLSCMGRTG